MGCHNKSTVIKQSSRCTCISTWSSRWQVRVQVQVHWICTRVQLEYKYRYHVLHLWQTVHDSCWLDIGYRPILAVIADDKDSAENRQHQFTVRVTTFLLVLFCFVNVILLAIVIQFQIRLWTTNHYHIETCGEKLWTSLSEHCSFWSTAKDVHLKFAKNGSKHKRDKIKSRTRAKNHSWFQVISRVISSNNRVIEMWKQKGTCHFFLRAGLLCFACFSCLCILWS